MSLFSDIKHLLRKSTVYGFGYFLINGIHFLLLPLYTRYLKPEEFGIIYLGRTITFILSIFLSLGVHRAVTYFYYEVKEEDERRRNLGTMWVFMMVISIGLTVLFDRFGNAVFPLMIQSISFDPFIRLSIWTAFFNTLGLLPLSLLQAKEQAGLYISLTALKTLITVTFVIKFIAFDSQGAYGYLWGTLLASVLMVIPYALVTLNNVTIGWKIPTIKRALGYSLPLVPHDLAGWALEYSDRVILEKFVSLGAIGIYSFGYQISILMGNIAMSVKDAWLPFLFKSDGRQEKSNQQNLSRMVTYYVLGLSWIALGISLFTKPLLIFFVDPSYLPAYGIIPWVILGQLCNGFYYVPVNFLFLKSKTGWIPAITLAASLCSIGFNLLLVPQFGIMAAAWITFLAYAVMLMLAWVIAYRIYPFPYEYKRIFHILFLFAILFWLGSSLDFTLTSIEFLARSILWIVFPGILVVSGFLLQSERLFLQRVVRRLLIGQEP